MNAHPINLFMDNYSLKENQHKIAEAIFNDYSVLKFGEYGETNKSFSGQDVIGFTKVTANPLKIYYSVHSEDNK